MTGSSIKEDNGINLVMKLFKARNLNSETVLTKRILRFVQVVIDILRALKTGLSMLERNGINLAMPLLKLKNHLEITE